ncbi:hypothetical protein Droror1_Dr00020675 [Drosera rotundifolia]
MVDERTNYPLSHYSKNQPTHFLSFIMFYPIPYLLYFLLPSIFIVSIPTMVDANIMQDPGKTIRSTTSIFIIAFIAAPPVDIDDIREPVSGSLLYGNNVPLFLLLRLSVCV